MKARTRLATIHFTAAILLAGAAAARQAPKPATNDFLIRAPAAEIAAIAARNGLEILRMVEVSPDALGRSVFEVRAPSSVGADQVLDSVRLLEPAAVGIEEVFLASLPETYDDVDLGQRGMNILNLLSDPTEVPFGRDDQGRNRDVWQAFVNQPGAALLRVDEANKARKGRATVAIIDTGVDPDHELLRPVLVPGYDFLRDERGAASEWQDVDQRGMNILNQRGMNILNDEEVVPLNAATGAILAGDGVDELAQSLPPAFGHGTMVAGIVHRVAPEASLMPLRAFDGWGRGNLVDIVRAIYYAVDHGANVINMSFSLETFSPELMRAINYAARKGVACVASTGNEGRETIIYPAALGNTIGVAATGDDDYMSAFSNRGSDLVTVAAPGQDVVTAYPGSGWALASGTSFAAPWISGAIALFADKNGRSHDPGRADYFFANTALSFAVPVHGVPAGAAGYGRADLKAAIDRLEKPSP